MGQRQRGFNRDVGGDAGDGGIVGIATDAELKTTLPVAHLDDIPAIAAMMQKSALSIEDVLARSVTES